MRTTAGTYASQTIKTRTLTLADTSGIAVCFGAVEPPELLEEAKEALTHMRARWSSRIQIETTHFVCTHPSGPAPAVTPPSDSPKESPDPGMEYRRAAQLSIPIVQPAWIMACLREKRMVPISAFTLDKAALSGGPSSSASLGKNASSRSQHAAQQPRDGPREPIQLQKPPPPKHASPEAVTAAPLPDVAVQTSQDIESAAPAPAPAEAVRIPVAEDVSDLQQKDTSQTPNTSEHVPTETVLESVVPSADVAVKESQAQDEKADTQLEAGSTDQSPEKVVQPDIASDAVIDPTEPTHEAVTEPETQLEEASLASESQKDAETTQKIPIEQEDDVAESFQSADERSEVVQTSAPAEQENEASATKLDNEEEPSNAAAVQEAKDDSNVEKEADVEVNDNNESETMEEVKL